jgi:hypothetical protein
VRRPAAYAAGSPHPEHHLLPEGVLTMLRLLGALLALVCCVGLTIADEYDAKIKSVDADKSKAVVTINNQDKTFELAKDPLIVNDKGKNVPGGLKALKAGTEVIIFTDKKDGKETITTFKVKVLPKKK